MHIDIGPARIQPRRIVQMLNRVGEIALARSFCAARLSGFGLALFFGQALLLGQPVCVLGALLLCSQPLAPLGFRLPSLLIFSLLSLRFRLALSCQFLATGPSVTDCRRSCSSTSTVSKLCMVCCKAARISAAVCGRLSGFCNSVR